MEGAIWGIVGRGGGVDGAVGLHHLYTNMRSGEAGETSSPSRGLGREVGRARTECARRLDILAGTEYAEAEGSQERGAQASDIGVRDGSEKKTGGGRMFNCYFFSSRLSTHFYMW